MRKFNIIAAVALAAVLLLGAGWYMLSPGWTVKAMVDAAQSGDGDRFSSYVDYPALRADMKAELTQRLQAEGRRDTSPEARIGVAMGLAMMGPIVDRMVSPKAMQSALARISSETKTGGAGNKGGDKPAKPEIHRQGLSRFLLAGKGRADSGLVFERRGLGWKLTGIDLPAEMKVEASRK